MTPDLDAIRARGEKFKRGGFVHDYGYRAASRDVLALLAELDAREATIIKVRRLNEQHCEHLMHVTSLLDEHPEEYDGPCFCKLCMSRGSRAMTLDLDPLKAMCEAMEGRQYEVAVRKLCDDEHADNLSIILHARRAMPELIAEVERLREENAEWQQLYVKSNSPRRP